jgi:parallel beta-helix repeat protein
MYKKIGLFLILFSLILTGKAFGEEVTVSSSEELREALSSDREISIIKIKPGRYNGNFSVEKRVHIIGEKGVKLFGLESGNVLTIEADDVIVESLEIEGSGSQNAGIYVKGDRSYLHHNALNKVFHGIYARDSYGHRFENNIISSFDSVKRHKGYGIYLVKAPNTAVKGNYFYDTQDGVYVSYSDFCEISGNQMLKSRYGVHTMDSRNILIAHNQVTESINGLMIMQSYEISIMENYFYLNTKIDGAGMFIYDTFDSKISSNIVKGNFRGIVLENAKRNRLEFNTFLENDTGLEIGINSTDNTIYLNNFYRNTRQIISDKDNSNYFNKEEYGNYYDDHSSLNMNSDSKVDFAYKSGDVFYQMASKEPLLQVFFQSPAVELWNTVEQITPIPSDSLIVDEAPLAKPAQVKWEENTSETQVSSSSHEMDLILFFMIILFASLFILMKLGGSAMKLKHFFVIIGLGLLLTACSFAAAGPVDIKLNKDSCDVCHMGIEEMESAAQLILKNGKPVLFDDIGCMTEYLQTENPEYEAAFVHDYQSKEWISFDTSSFIQNQNIDSPMSYGIAAFKSKDDAAAFQREYGGDAYTKAELLNTEIKSFKKPGMSHSH